MSIRGNREQRRVEAVSRMSEMDRRTFVKLSGASAAALILGYGPFTERVWAAPRFSDYPFSLGVASGDPLPDGVVLWTRLAPDPLNGGGMPNKKVPVPWQVATDENFANVVREGMEFARPELAHTVHVEVSGLKAASEYFYHFKAGPELSPVGRTKTAPAAGASVAEMNFAFVSCQQYEHGYFTAYRRMAEQEQLDLVVHLGDYIYEYGPNQYRAPGGNVRAHSGPEIVTLSDYRNPGFIQNANVRNPVVLTGDVHNNWANDLKADYDDQNSETIGVEFVGTSITSGGDGADTSPNQEVVKAENPHIKFFNGQRGYVRCRLTPEEWRADYKVLPFVKQPGAPVYTRASFVVEAGNPGLQQADINAVQGTRVSSTAIESDAKRIEAQEEAGRKGGKRRRGR